MSEIENKHTPNDSVIIMLTREELRIIHQALNEVCNGIEFSEAEFATRIGVGCAEARTLLFRLGIIYDNPDRSES